MQVVDMVGSVTGIATVALLSEQVTARAVHWSLNRILQSMYGWPMGVGNTLVLVFSSVHYKM